MSNRLWTAVAVVALGLGITLTLTAVNADEPIKSGPQVGQEVPGPFHPLNITGSAAGKKNCLYCSAGDSPVAVVFARKLTPEVKTLIKQLDQQTVKNAGKDMCSFAVFCSDNEKLGDELKAFADSEKLSKLVLSIDNPAGPTKYKIASDADVTVFFYEAHVVKATHAFRASSELNDATITRVVSDVKTIVPAN
jgi:hypothetical protein